MTNHSRIAALVLALGSLITLALGTTVSAGASPLASQPAPPQVTPNTDSCPYVSAPPPAVDASEVPKPDQTAPAPLPRPSTPAGGAQLGQCGLVTPSAAPPMPQGISAASWVIADLDTGKVLAAKDPHGLHRPASTMKLLTASVALDKLPLDEVIIGTQADADVEGSSVGVGPGGSYTVRELLLGLLLESGNDAAHALSARMGGDAATVEAMNALARSLGASDTRAATPSGLDAPGMSTSAYDLALIFRHDIANPSFAALATTRSMVFPGYADKPAFLIANQDKLLESYPGAIGGKNGFTNDARQTYVGAAGRDGHRLVVTLMQAERVPLAPEKQAAALLDYGFALPATASVGELTGPADNATTTSSSAKTMPGAGASAAGAPDQWNGYATLGLAFAALVGVAVLVRTQRRRS